MFAEIDAHQLCEWNRGHDGALEAAHIDGPAKKDEQFTRASRIDAHPEIFAGSGAGPGYLQVFRGRSTGARQGRAITRRSPVAGEEQPSRRGQVANGEIFRCYILAEPVDKCGGLGFAGGIVRSLHIEIFQGSIARQEFCFAVDDGVVEGDIFSGLAPNTFDLIEEQFLDRVDGLRVGKDENAGENDEGDAKEEAGCAAAAELFLVLMGNSPAAWLYCRHRLSRFW